MSNKDDNIRNSIPFVRQITEDGKAKLEIYRPTTNPIYIYTQVSQVCNMFKFLNYFPQCDNEMSARPGSVKKKTMPPQAVRHFELIKKMRGEK